MQLRNNHFSWSILLTIINMLLYIYTYYYVTILLLQLTMLAIYVSRENGAIICILICNHDISWQCHGTLLYTMILND